MPTQNSMVGTVLAGLQSALGKVGKKKYETREATPPFQGLALKEKLRTIVNDVRIGDRERRIRMLAVHYLMTLYYQGYQNVEMVGTNAFDVYEREDFYVENQFRRHVDYVVNMLSKAEGEILVRPASDNPIDISTARVADSVLDMMKNNENVDYTKLRDLKNRYKALYGTAFVFNDYIVDAKYGTVVTPKYDYQDVPDPTDPLGEPYFSKVMSGTTTRNMGSEIALVCSPLEVSIRPDVKGGIENIPYLQWIGYHYTETVNYVYPGLNIPYTSSYGQSDMTAQYLDILGNLSGGPILGDSAAFNRGGGQRDKCELVRTWLKPCMFRGDTELQNAFPSGVHVTTVNGEVVDWYEEDLCDRWTIEVLIPLPHSIMGDGLYDAILMQDQLNEINSLLIQHMRYSTVGHTFYDALVIDPKDVVNDPKNGFVPGRPALDKSIQSSVVHYAPNQLSGDVPAWRGAILQSMQDMSSAYDPSTGKGLGANTPYSQSVFLNERAQSRWEGSNNHNRGSVIKFHRQLLKIAQENWVDERKRAVMDNTGAWSFEQFSQADIQGNVDITLTNSDMKPRTRPEQAQALNELVQLMPILGMLPPEQKIRVEEMLGLPPDANPMSRQITRAYRIIDRIKKGEVVTPLVLVDDAQAQVPVFQDFLVSEQGEELANEDPQAYANVHTYMVSLMQMGMMMMASGIGLKGGQPPQPPNQGSPEKPGGQPGGQPGQKGGGPGAAEQPNAQSPAQPAPPVSAPSA